MKIAGVKVLVTGADGFIGSHLCERLVEQGAQVRALVQYNSFNRWGWLEHCPEQLLDAIEIVPGDIRDGNFVRKVMTGCEIVFHLAALIAIPFSYHAPAAYIDTNITGTLNVLQAATSLSVAKVIHTSTSEVYGSAQYVPIDESHPLQGQSPYAASKIAADQLSLSFYYSFNTPVAIIRPFNTYGPRQSARAVIPTVITQALAKNCQQLNIGSLLPRRDFNFISDTVSAFIQMAVAENIFGEVINIGTQSEVSIGETIAMITEILQQDINIVSDEQRIRPKKSEVQRLLADNTKARQLLNWEPQYSGKDGLRKGLEQTIQWFQQWHESSEYNQIYKTDCYQI